MFIIDSAAGNAIFSNKWTSGSGWGGWTSFESASQTRNYLTAVYGATPTAIAVAWAATNGSNYDFTVESFSTAGGVGHNQSVTINGDSTDYGLCWHIDWASNQCC
jgi:hypothetical protein